MRTLYNRYIPNGEAYRRIPEEEPERHPHAEHPRREEAHHPPPPPKEGALGALTGKLGGLLKGFRKGKLDSGDILLVLILLFLFLESDDDLELVITLGLLLLFGLFGKDTEEDKKTEEEP